MVEKTKFIDRLPAYIQAGLRGYKGRVDRTSYWRWLILVIISVIPLTILIVIFPNPTISYVVVTLWIICGIVLNILVSIGRLHDMGFSFWWYLPIMAIPYLISFLNETGGTILAIVLFCFLGFYPPDVITNQDGKEQIIKQ